MSSMMCEPAERDLMHALRRAVAAARAAGRTDEPALRAAALAELQAVWPHLPTGDAAAAVERLLPPLLAEPPAKELSERA